jgi:hypothetical protein
VIKTVGGEDHPEQLSRLQAAAAGPANVTVRDGYVTREEHQALVSACDAFVSLHRAEGYGLHIAEAMALGKPVIATGYSGNLEFMDDTNSLLVPYELVGIPDGRDPYPAGARWAEPDLDAAVRAMRTIVDDPAFARTLGERAAGDIARLHSPYVRGQLVADLLGRVPQRVSGGIEETSGGEVGTEPVIEGRDVLPFDEVFDQVKSGPPAAGPTTRMPRLVAFVRRLLTRVNKNAAEHQKRVDLTLAYKVNHLLGETEDLPEVRKVIEELTLHIRELDARLIKEREYRRELAEELQRLDPGWHAPQPGADGGK